MTKLFLYLLFGLFVLTDAEPIGKRQCQSRNDSDYPLCATNGTHWFLFRNERRLNSENRNRARTGATILQKTEISNCFKRCDQVCTDEFAPICARTSAAQRTFQNRCQLDLENCKSGNIWIILHEGECPPTPLPVPVPCDSECPTSCPQDYDPVCASFGDSDQTFQNLCYLKVDACNSQRAWQVKNNGECNPSPECNEACPRIYSPICATFNGENRTFSNECLLDTEICVTGNQWSILYSGECIDPPPSCPRMCPEIYEPVCASRYGERRTFPNQCFADAEICNNGEVWNVEYNGECRDPSKPCPQSCPFIYQPVCATYNGVTRTFSNQCLLNAVSCLSGENWEVISDGECTSTTTETTTTATPEPTTTLQPTTTSNCPDACPTVYMPICAGYQGSQRTFSNFCFLSSQNCRTGQNWEILYDGECDEEVTDPPTSAVCPTVYDPVCANFNGELRTFPNECQMNAEIARTNQVWKIVNLGECLPETTTVLPTGPCPKCSDFYQPVCAFSDGEQRTFTNECQMMGENCYSNRKWVLVYQGECRVSDLPRNCPNICPLNYDPVCATFNGEKRTFPNQCELNHEAYRTNSPWVILNTGECDYCPLCSDVIDPVCAEFDGQTVTFDNPCRMEYENCKNGTAWKIVSKGTCDCPTFCPRVLDAPICATNSNNENRTFASICEMKMESCATQIEWRFLTDGACPPPPPPPVVTSPPICPMSYDPVCATSCGVLRTFRNEFALQLENCRTNKNWVIVQAGPCPPPPPVDPVPPCNSPDSRLLTVFLNCLKNTMSGAPSGPVRQPQPHPPRRCMAEMCTNVYDPVCGVFNGEMRTFPNTCYMQNAGCRNGEDWQLAYFGECRTPN